MVILLVLFFFSYFIFANIDVYCKEPKIRKACLLVLTLALCIIVGFRSIEWPDTGNYISAFKAMSSDLLKNDYWVSYSNNKFYYGYGECGFIFITKIIKVITDNWAVYLFLISVITFGFLYKFLSQYGLYPIIGLFIYIGRFMIFRNMAQIRTALALTIILLSLKYAHHRKLIKYSIIIGFASLFHISALIALPFYFINAYRFGTKQIIIILSASALFAIFCETFLTGFVQNISVLSGMGQSYVGGTEKYSTGLGILNPVIYYQSFLLIIYSYLSSKIESKVKYYNTVKNAYLTSTVLLISLSPFLVLSGRLSTIFATLEICILPSFIIASSRKNKEFAILLIGLLSTGFLFINLSKLDFWI